jgi:hypothetical protein
MIGSYEPDRNRDFYDRIGSDRSLGSPYKWIMYGSDVGIVMVLRYAGGSGGSRVANLMNPALLILLEMSI